MKKVFLLTAILTLTVTCFSQIPAYDALKLRALGVGTRVLPDSSFELPDGNNSVLKVLKYYAPVTDTADGEKVETYFNGNPYLHVASISHGFGTPSASRFLPASFASLNVTNIADGLAKFLVERVKEELAVAFFRQFKDDMNDPKYSDLQILFPQTKLLLEKIDDQIYRFSSYLTDLRDAFIEDLNNIPYNCPTVLDQPKYAVYFNRHPEFKAVLKLAALTANLFRNGDVLHHPGEALAGIDPDHFFKPDAVGASTVEGNLNGGLKVMQLVSGSIRSLDAARFWLNTDSLALVINDDVTFNIYLGLIYQQAKLQNIVVNGQLLTAILHDAKKDINAVRNSIFSLALSFKSIDENIRRIREINAGRAMNPPQNKDSIYRYYYATYTSALDAVETGVQLVSRWRPNIDLGIAPYISDFRNLGEVYLDVSQKRYALAVVSVCKLVTNLLDQAYTAGAIKKDQVAAKKILAKLTLYGTFAADVARAESSDEVKDIIARTVLPTGSAYIKKQSSFNVALNAYTGLYGGKQRQRTDDHDVRVGGVYAPVGLALSHGFYLGKGKHSPWSVTAFFSMIDIGPLVSYRFSHYNDTLANDVQVRLGQIVSPGAHLVFGLPKWPLSVGGGFNWSPLITKVEKTAVTLQPNNSNPLRWEIFVAVDIPLLNFYNKPK